MHGPLNVKNECQHVEFAKFEMETALGHIIEATFMHLDDVICIRKMRNFCYAI
jgi:hypothetical protein